MAKQRKSAMRRRHKRAVGAHTASTGTNAKPPTHASASGAPKADSRPARARAQRRKRSFRPALVFIAMAAAGATAVLSFFPSGWWAPVRSTRVTANLSQVGAVNLTPSSQSDGSISPVCGCLATKVNEWRGITFAGREIALRRSGSAPQTEWLVSGTSLRPIELTTAETRMTVDIFWFDAKRFNASWVLGGLKALKRHATNVSHVRLRAHTLKIITSGSLNVEMTGPAPVGDWIPLPGSKVALSSLPTPFPTSTPSLRLTENYPAKIGMDSSDKVVTQQGYPLGDFLGPNLVLWSKGEMPFATDTFAIGRGPKTPASIHAVLPMAFLRIKGQIYAAVIRNSSFSTRVAAVPLSGNGLSFLMYNLSEARTWQQQLDGFQWGSGDHGRVTLTVERPLTPDAYAHMRASVETHPIVRMRYWRDTTLTPDPNYKPPPGSRKFLYNERSVDIPESALDSQGRPYQVLLSPALNRSTSYNRGWVTEEDHYPPLPPNAGFNVFGPLTDLQLNSAVGAISMGGSEVTLPTPRTLHLQDLRNFQNVGSAQTLVSVPMVTANGTADLEFSGVGKVSIDGHDYSTAAQRNARRLRFAIDLVGLISGSLAIGVAVAAVLSRLREPRHPPA